MSSKRSNGHVKARDVKAAVKVERLNEFELKHHRHVMTTVAKIPDLEASKQAALKQAQQYSQAIIEVNGVRASWLEYLRDEYKFGPEDDVHEDGTIIRKGPRSLASQIEEQGKVRPANGELVTPTPAGKVQPDDD